MRRILYAGKLSQVDVIAIEPFVSANEALAALNMQKVTLADKTTAVLTQEELDRCLTTIPDPEVIEEAPVEPVDEPTVEAAPETQPVEEVKEPTPEAPLEPAVVDQDTTANQS